MPSSLFWCSWQITFRKLMRPLGDEGEIDLMASSVLYKLAIPEHRGLFFCFLPTRVRGPSEALGKPKRCNQSGKPLMALAM